MENNVNRQPPTPPPPRIATTNVVQEPAFDRFNPVVGRVPAYREPQGVEVEYDAIGNPLFVKLPVAPSTTVTMLRLGRGGRDG